MDLNNPKMIGPYDPEANWKRELIRYFAKRFDIKTFIETGTSYGDTIEAVKDSFEEIGSVELSGELYAKAADRFKLENKIFILAGSSSKMLSFAIDFISHFPILFWLDAHATGEFPGNGDQVNLELKIIKEMAPDSLVLIDDVKPIDGYFMSPDGIINTFGWTMKFLHGVLILHAGSYDIPEVF